MGRNLGRRELEAIARAMRREVVDLCYRSPNHKAHLGGSLSCVDILAALYADVMETGVGATGAAWGSRDRFVLSKAHAAVALYAALHQAGFLSDEEMSEPVCGHGTLLYRQTQRDLAHGIEISGGSLGQGLGLSAGLALALARKRLPSRVFCLLGDGETNEGSIWESVAFASHNALSNLVILVDRNGFQLDGPTSEVVDSGSLLEEFRAFGLEAEEVDGNDVAAVRDALAEALDRGARGGGPQALVCDTVKGKGLSFAEGRVEWHDNVLTEDLYHVALDELAEGGDPR